MQALARVAAPKGRPLTLVLASLGAVGVLVLLGVLVALLQASPVAVDRSPQSIFRFCVEQTQSSSNLPSGAVFPSFQPAYVKQDSETAYTVRAYADGRNERGAPVRVVFVCQARASAGGELEVVRLEVQ
jgi:hypothetical protein